MSRKTVVCLGLVSALALTGCSDQSTGRGGQGGASQTVAPSPSSSAATTTAVNGLDTVCRLVDTAVTNLLLDHGLALADQKKNKTSDAVLRAQFAQSYRNFTNRLSPLALDAPENLRLVLAEWASASTEIARFIDRQKPRAGIVVDFGPAQKRENAAEKAAEKICGYKFSGSPD